MQKPSPEKMKVLEVAKILCACCLVLNSSCACYHSTVEANFKEERPNSQIHPKFTGYYKSEGGRYSDINPFFMVITKPTSGKIRITSHQQLGIYSSIIFEQISLQDKAGGHVDVNLDVIPIRLNYKQTENSRWTKGKRIPFEESTAELNFSPNLETSRSPYKIELRGYFLEKGGIKKRFVSIIEMKLVRNRRFESIVECWP